MAIKLVEGQKVVENVGTLAFSAPEVIMNEAYDFKADVWSLGIICYTLVSTQLPFATSSTSDRLIELITKKDACFNASVWSIVSAKCKDLISKMLIKD